MLQFTRYSKYKDSGVEWLGIIPEGWYISRLKYLTKINSDSLPENTNGSFEFEYVDIGSVSYENGIEKTEHFTFANAPSRARRLAKNGDTVISTVRTYLKAIDLITQDKSKYIFSTGFAVLTPIEMITPQFLLHFVRSSPFTNQVDIFSKGMSYPAINSTDLGCLSVFSPPLPEQTAIAAFLDEKTVKIDKAILQKEKLIALLKERKQIIIQNAVTKGLDPNAKMKDSGVEWIGEIPEGWSVIKLKNASNIIQTGPFGTQLHAHDYVISGIPLLNPKHMVNGHIYPEDECSVSTATLERLSKYKLIKGDLILARRGELGRCAVINDREDGWLCGTGSIMVRLKTGVLNVEYLYQFISGQGVAETLSLSSVGSTMDNLNTTILGELFVLVPKFEKQSAIIDFITNQSAKIDNAIAVQEKQIDKLKEYKATLIDSAVTGKIKVC